MKVLLIQPPLNPNIIGAGTGFLTEPLALEILAASIPHHDVHILDMRIDNNLTKTLDSFRPDIVGITSLTPDVYIAKEILFKIKKYNQQILTVIGGHHATMIPEDFKESYIDVVVIGEGEVTFKELVDAFEKKDIFSNIKGIAFKNGEKDLFFTTPRELISNMDDMPVPNRSLTANHRNEYFRGSWRPVASIMTSKGCPFRCNFCALWKINNGKYFVRSPESVVDELENIKEHFIDFAEDNALHDIPRAEKIYELIKKRGIKKTYKLYARSDTIVRHPEIVEKWKEIGMELVLIGLESFKDDELKELNKHNTISNNEKAVSILQENGVEIAAYFIINPNYIKEDFDRLAEYVQKLNLKQPIFTVLTPLPGTDFYKEKYNELTTHNYQMYDFVHSVLPTKLPTKDFYKCLIELYRKTYASAITTMGANKIMAQLTNIGDGSGYLGYKSSSIIKEYS
ncbi:MAG: radical SAM protein [Elusimicrobia bacterium]|nr:radical SAM protein [Elusimicrobiota bacterium]